jgi:peptidyl-prolyl cis-trans isomerase SurA
MRSRNLLLPALSALLATAASPEILERVVAKVNGDIVTLSEFQSRQVAAVQAAGLSTDDRIERFLRENNARILQEAIDDLLLVQQAQEQGMRLRPDYIKEIIDGIKKENNITSDDELQQQLRREGMSLDDLKRNIERSIMKRQLLSHELESKIAVTEDEVRADYEAHRADYDRPGSLHLQEIVVKTESGSPTLANDLVRRARAGEDFSELARAYSARPRAAAGGDLGRVSRGDLTPDIEKAALALPVGGVSDPLLHARGLPHPEAGGEDGADAGAVRGREGRDTEAPFLRADGAGVRGLHGRPAQGGHHRHPGARSPAAGHRALGAGARDPRRRPLG